MKVNYNKSDLLTLGTSEEEANTFAKLFCCNLGHFPIKYLGVPLSPLKLTRNQIQPFIDKIADRLPSWKAGLLTKAGQKILVQSVLTSMTIYLLMALDLL